MPDEPRPLTDYHKYVSNLCAHEDHILTASREAMYKAQLPKIHVSPSEGKLLHVLALMMGAQRILEIGTLGGYSTIWLGRALPDNGRLISLEIDPHHAEVAKKNIESAGLTSKIEIRTGTAIEMLKGMIESGEKPFDLVFIDADKDGYPAYLEYAVLLTRIGGVILADNTLTHGVLDPTTDNGITRYNALVGAHPQLVSIIIPVLREQLDGLFVSVKTME